MLFLKYLLLCSFGVFIILKLGFKMCSETCSCIVVKKHCVNVIYLFIILFFELRCIVVRLLLFDMSNSNFSAGMDEINNNNNVGMVPYDSFIHSFINFHWSYLARATGYRKRPHTSHVICSGLRNQSSCKNTFMNYNFNVDKIHWINGNHLTSFLKDTMVIHNLVIWHLCTIVVVVVYLSVYHNLKPERYIHLYLNSKLKLKYRTYTVHVHPNSEKLLSHQAYIIYN
jgi:hypothetical protein